MRVARRTLEMWKRSTPRRSENAEAPRHQVGFSASHDSALLPCLIQQRRRSLFDHAQQPQSSIRLEKL